MQEPNKPCNYAPPPPPPPATVIRSKQPQPPLTVPAGSVGFRLVCHASRIGGVIGKSGSIIKQLQQDTSAKIRIEESIPNSADRVIFIIASNALDRKITLKLNGASDSEEIEVSAAQEAVIRVFERVLDVAAETDGLMMASRGVVTCRLLAEARQVGSVIGKGGKMIEKIREDTGCRIRVLSFEKISACAASNDEVVEIEGEIMAVKKALVAVSRCLQDWPLVDRSKTTGSRSLDSVAHETLREPNAFLRPDRSSSFSHIPTNFLSKTSGDRPLSIEADCPPVQDTRARPEEVVFKLLCSNARVGGVIGKGGSIIKALQNETGASISVGTSVADCDERLIIVTAAENSDSQYSPAQNAVIVVFNRTIEAGIEKGLDSRFSEGSSVHARLVVPSNQVGCLLGKGGMIISAMRKSTGAAIRIIGGDQVPKCASEGDEVVQITGKFANVRNALYKVTGRLRENIFPSKMLDGAGTRSSSSLTTDPSPYRRGRDQQSLGLHSSTAIRHSHSRHTTLTQSMDHLNLSNNLNGHPSPKLWASQTIAGMNARSIMDVDRGLTPVKGGKELDSGNSTPIVNTTVEILVAENVIDSIYGENGSNLARLRQISGAKVIVQEPSPGTSERMVVISGSPDETQAAQSLLQAFILTGSS